MSVANTWQ